MNADMNSNAVSSRNRQKDKPEQIMIQKGGDQPPPF